MYMKILLIASYTQNIKHVHNSRCGSAKKPIEVLDAEKRAEESLDAQNPDIIGDVVGSSMDIEQIPIGSGAISLGMAWMPAPMKFHSPLSHFNHENSIPKSPIIKVRSISELTKSRMTNLKEKTILRAKYRIRICSIMEMINLIQTQSWNLERHPHLKNLRMD